MSSCQFSIYLGPIQIAPAMALFHHRPLSNPQTIRRLILLPAHNTADPLQCELEEISFTPGNRSIYEALSYVWGSPCSDFHVLCHGKILQITENCDAALRRLRSRSRSRALWVDSICIDQASNEERSEQVKLMAEIYRRARRILMWLGPGTEKSDRAMRYIVKFHKQGQAAIDFIKPLVIFDHTIHTRK